MPALPTRIEIVVIDSPIRTRSLALSVAGAQRATLRCGKWPAVGTIDDYLTAVRRARREVEHCATLAGRYWRRFGRDLTDHPRFRSRSDVALELFEERSECLHRLTEPEWGEA